MGMRRSGANSQLWNGYRSSRKEGWEKRQRGGEQERLPRQLLTALLFLSTAKWTRTRGVSVQFIQGNQHLHYTYSMQMNRNLSKVNLCLSVCTFSWTPLKYSDVWANYRWTSHVRGHKDISEPVSSLQPFIKHWQFSAIIITGSEKTWLNRI